MSRRFAEKLALYISARLILSKFDTVANAEKVKEALDALELAFQEAVDERVRAIIAYREYEE